MYKIARRALNKFKISSFVKSLLVRDDSPTVNQHNQLLTLLMTFITTLLMSGPAVASNESYGQMLLHCRNLTDTKQDLILPDLIDYSVYYDYTHPSNIQVVANYINNETQVLNLDSDAFTDKRFSLPSPERLNGKSHFSVSKTVTGWRMTEISADDLRSQNLSCKEYFK